MSCQMSITNPATSGAGTTPLPPSLVGGAGGGVASGKKFASIAQSLLYRNNIDTPTRNPPPAPPAHSSFRGSRAGWNCQNSRSISQNNRDPKRHRPAGLVHASTASGGKPRAMVAPPVFSSDPNAAARRSAISSTPNAWHSGRRCGPTSRGASKIQRPPSPAVASSQRRSALRTSASGTIFTNQPKCRGNASTVRTRAGRTRADASRTGAGLRKRKRPALTRATIAANSRAIRLTGSRSATASAHARAARRHACPARAGSHRSAW